MTLQERQEKAFKDACQNALDKINEYQHNPNAATCEDADDAIVAARAAALALSNSDVFSPEVSLVDSIRNIFAAVLVDKVKITGKMHWLEC